MSNVISFNSKPTQSERFESVMEPHFDALYKAARRMTLSAHDADDLVQEVCVTALTRLDELERIEYKRAWLLRVMYNRFVDDVRRSGRSPVDNAPTGEASSEPDDIAAGMAQPDELVDREQNVERVLRAMRRLDPDHCALVAMHDVEGLSIDELCKLTGMPNGTIKSRLHRIRIKVGRLLSNDAVAGTRLKVVGGKK